MGEIQPTASVPKMGNIAGPNTTQISSSKSCAQKKRRVCPKKKGGVPQNYFDECLSSKRRKHGVPKNFIIVLIAGRCVGHSFWAP